MAFKHHISFVTDLAANFGCYWFRIMPNIVSKSESLRAAIWSCCAVQFESEWTVWTPFAWTGSLFRSAALHRIWLGTCCFVPHILPYFTQRPMTYFTQRPMTDGTMEGSANGSCFGRQLLLASSIEHFISHENKSYLLLPKIYKALKPFDSWIESVLQER